MKRQSVPAGKDKRVFSNSASHTKAINVSPKVYRGGIRL